MPRVNEENVTGWMILYLSGAEAKLDKHPLGMGGIGEFTGRSFVIGSMLVEQMGTMKRVSRWDRDKAMAYMCIALPSGPNNPSGLDQETQDVLTEALLALRPEFSKKTLQALDAAVPVPQRSEPEPAESPTATTVEPLDIKNRLDRLDDLLRSGAITENEYERKRQDILDTL